MKIKINNIEFLVNKKFNPDFWNYVSLGKWEPHTFEIIDNFVSENSKVIDIGSWIGPLSLYMAGKGANVYSIEPDFIAYEELILNLKLNPTLNKLINPFRLAITSRSEKVKLYARKNHGDSSSSILNRITSNGDHINVNGVSFNKFLDISKLKQVEFIKMDIEGGEFEILPNIVSIVEKIGLPTIFISFHYSYLNEFLYQEKFRSKKIAYLLLKLERKIGYRFFKTKIISIIENALNISKKYKYIYTEYGEKVKFTDLNPDLMIKNKMNLVISNKKWKINI